MNNVGIKLGLGGRLDDADLIDYIRAQRWFGSRTREITGIELVDAVPVPDKSKKWIALLELQFEAGTHEIYQLVLGLGERGSVPDAVCELDDLVLYEAGEDPALAQLLTRAPRSGATLKGFDGTLELRGIGPRYDATAEADIRPLRAEQTNTSIVVGDSLLVKMYRRIEAGLAPELEMLLFFTEKDFDFVPHAAGWYSYSGSHLRATLGVSQRFLRDARDGWTLGLNEVPTAPELFLGRVSRLGAVIGEMHRVLASDSDDAAFTPEEPTSETAGLLAATIEEQIDDLFAILPEDPSVARIVGRADELREIVRALAPAVTTGRLIRTHGDLHLGQVLWSDGEWYVTDFEGEPDRSISDRRRKMLPLRDVAGMLRSFAYLVAALDDQGNSAPDDFEDEARVRLLAAYREALDGTSLLPTTDGVQERLLDLFELEKALYELRYELEHRPDRVGVPVAGLIRFLERSET